MTQANPENTPEVQSAAPAPQPQPIDTRRRLRELLSVPERDRSDEQWDEIIELEIQLAPGNRISGNEGGGGAGRPQGAQGRPAPGGGHAQKKYRSRTNDNRRSRQNKTPSGGNPA